MNFSHYQPFGSIPQPHLVDSDADSTFSPFPCLGHHQTHQMALAPIHSAAASFPGTSTEMDAQQQQIQHNPLDHLWVDVQCSTFACLWAECEQRFVGGEVFEAHMGQHLAGYASLLQESETSPVCQVRGCQILVSSVEELSRHLKMHIFHANKQRCGLLAVKERYPELTGFFNHNFQVETNPFISNSCKFPATSRLVYQGDPLICEWDSCNASFIDINEYMAHIDQHVKVLDYKVNRNEQGLYICAWTDCQVTFKHKASLRVHIQHHSGDKMSACPFCGAFFSHNSRLLEHVTRRQPGELMCQFCRKMFMNESTLRKHCKRHIKQHKCNFCSLVADTPNDLRRHIEAVHAKVKNHICEYCGRGFFQKSDFNRHVELHFRDMLHECKTCGNKYRWAKQLREHEKQHRKDFIPSPYQCHLCDCRYRRGSALSKHLAVRHQIELPVGFSRFQYKKCADGLFRLQTLRYVHETNEEEEENEEVILN